MKPISLPVVGGSHFAKRRVEGVSSLRIALFPPFLLSACNTPTSILPDRSGK